MRYKGQNSPSHLFHYLVIASFILLVYGMMALKDRSQPEPPASSSLLATAQLERALRGGKPALGFFHSNNCDQCIIMIETVDQVFPEFSPSIDLIDVNVYDPKNKPLLQKVRLQYIPTLVFFDRTGQTQTHVGVMEAEVLQQRLSSLIGVQ